MKSRLLSIISLLIGIALFIYLLRQSGTAEIIVALCELTFHLAGVLEIYVTLHFIGAPTNLLTAFILEAVNRVLNIAFAFVPAMIGVDEAGTGLLTHILGLGTTAGVTLAIVRKARMLVWIGLGLVFLSTPQATSHKHNSL